MSFEKRGTVEEESKKKTNHVTVYSVGRGEKQKQMLKSYMTINRRGRSPNINHRLISGYGCEERGRENKKRREIAQLVLHPSSVWIGCQLDSGNIH